MTAAKPFPRCPERASPTLGELRAQLDLTQAELAAVRAECKMLKSALRHVLPLAVIEAKDSKVWAKACGAIELALGVTA